MPDVRRALPSDGLLLHALRRDREEWMARSSVDQWEPHSRSLNWYEESVARDEWWVVRGADALAGAIRVVWEDRLWAGHDGEAAYLHDLMVSTEASGQGLGGVLIERGCERARGRGLQRVRLDCMASNTALVGYYESHGFAVVGRCSEPYPHRGGWAWAALMERTIQP